MKKFKTGKIYLFSNKPNRFVWKCRPLWELVGECIQIKEYKGTASMGGTLWHQFEALAEIGDPPPLGPFVPDVNSVDGGRGFFSLEFDIAGTILANRNRYHPVRVLPREDVVYYAGADRIFPLFEKVLKTI